MVRLIGIGFVFLSCCAAGNYYSCLYETEYRNICMVCDMLTDIKSYIGYESMTLSEMMSRLQCDDEYSSFSFFRQDFKNGDIRDKLLTGLEKEPLFRSKEYNERLSRIIRLLGTTDKQTQLELVSGGISYFQGQAGQLRDRLFEKKRLYKSLGIASGALLSIILL